MSNTESLYVAFVDDDENLLPLAWQAPSSRGRAAITYGSAGCSAFFRKTVSGTRGAGSYSSRDSLNPYSQDPVELTGEERDS